MNEFAPTVSPDGARFAFVSNRTGSDDALHRADRRRPDLVVVGSGDDVAHRRAPTGRVRGRVLGPRRPADARAHLSAWPPTAAAYAPDDGFHRVIAATETHYFHTTGEFEVDVPAGPVPSRR